jgi:alpha-galactosidase
MNCLMGDPTDERERMIIDKAAAMGCEYYCLDCGWYDAGPWWDRVGEWMESKERFPNGLKAICDYAKSKGMVMGLWLEIEVMGTACELASKLPDDWFICRHGKRHIDNKRYLLDFRNPEVRKYCGDVVDRLVDEYGVGYFKVDYNVTMGYGSDLNSDSCADAIMDHYRCLYQWYKDIFKRHPELVIENCGSGGQRMDYGMLKLLSLQSTSDQTDYIYNSNIASNVATAVTPEQAGMWVYPYEDEREHVIYNMVNGLLLRPYISGMVWKLSEASMDLMREGIALYKEIRSDVKKAVPVFPLGFTSVKDSVLAYGLQTDDTLYLAVFTPGTDKAEIPLKCADRVKAVSVIYPNTEDCEYKYSDGVLTVQMPQKAAARLFKVELQ